MLPHPIPELLYGFVWKPQEEEGYDSWLKIRSVDGLG
jgi:hypothetical protein